MAWKDFLEPCIRDHLDILTYCPFNATYLEPEQRLHRLGPGQHGQVSPPLRKLSTQEAYQPRVARVIAEKKTMVMRDHNAVVTVIGSMLVRE